MSRTQGPPWAVLALVIWLLGALAAAAPLLMGWWRVKCISSQAEPMGDLEAEALVDRVREQLALRRDIILLRSARRIVPMVWGLRRPRLLLPAEAEGWPRERLHLVLIHELAHVKRGDYISQLVAYLACACYWFIPLAWLARRRLHDEQQRACDDVVLGASVRPSDYAEGLLAVTRGLERPGFVCAAAVAMARQSTLGRRIDAILDGKRSRSRATRRVVAAAALCALALLVPLSQLQALPGAVLMGTTADGESLYEWSPGESYPNRAQADPRLDQAVTVWRAGVSLADLFVEISEQTGVSIGFWPPDDQNTRVRLHLFLNSGEPPTLRDLMAQLMWVTDCSFGYTGRGRDMRYYLLSTTIGQGAQAALEAREARSKKDCEDRLQALRDGLREVEEALELSPEEAIDRYLGEEDALLLTTLDPARRAAAQIVCRHLPRLLETIRFDPALPPGHSQSFGTTVNLAPLSQEEREAAATAFPEYDVDYDDPRAFCILSVDGLPRVQLAPPRYGDTPVESWPGYETNVTVIDPSSDIRSRPEDEVALRRALGETISPAQEEAYVAGREAEIADERQRASQRQPARRSLSPEMRAQLENTTLSLSAGTHPTWEIEEEVGRATGLHVIADGLLDVEADLSGSGAEEGDINALGALQAFCNTDGRKFMRSPEWEWGDAGRFLSFRTTNRDIWRAAMLPQSLLDWLDGQIKSHLPEAESPGEGHEVAELDLPIEPEQWTHWLTELSDLQVQHGALVPHGEPGDPLDAARRSTWKSALIPAAEHPSMLRFLGTLTAAQWESAHAGTLRGPTDLSPDQMKLLDIAIHEKSGWKLQLPEGSRITIAISQGECESSDHWTHVTRNAAGERDLGGAGGGKDYSQYGAGAADWYRVNITARGRLEGDDEERVVLEKQVPFLPTSIHVSVNTQSGHDPA
jgi:beta-lactamase regulating signal transducer with metallopeptidase domain